MSAEFFLDTNILVYSLDDSSAEKRGIADDLIQSALASSLGCISFQVIQECLNVMTRKFKVPLSSYQAHEYLSEVLVPLCKVHSSAPLYERAIDIQSRWQTGWYDSLIVSSAIEANCSVLFSEDFQHNQSLGSLKVVNPFIDATQVHELSERYVVSC